MKLTEKGTTPHDQEIGVWRLVAAAWIVGHMFFENAITSE
jgi:hypothetical protein